MKRVRQWAVSIGALVVVGLLTGCGGGSFNLPATLTAMSIPQGTSATQKIAVTRTGNFQGEIEFTVTGAPTGMTATFDPVKTTATGNETTLTLTVGNAVAVQKYTVKVVASSGRVKKEVALEVNVQAKPEFSLAANPAQITVKQGATGTVAISLTRNATATGAVALSLEGAPAGVTGSFNPSSATANASTLTLTVAATAAPGAYNLTVRGRAHGLDNTAAVRLTVEALPNFSIVVPPSAEVKRGQSVELPVTLNRVGGFADPVQFEVEGAPTGVTATFDPNPAPAGTATLRITTTNAAATGSYVLRVRGTAGTISKAENLSLTITP